jgi:hypothetical protein
MEFYSFIYIGCFTNIVPVMFQILQYVDKMRYKKVCVCRLLLVELSMPGSNFFDRAAPDEAHCKMKSPPSLKLWRAKSGRLDSNQRPLRPERSALPGCATARNLFRLQFMKRGNKFLIFISDTADE